ncbi:putative bifunctional diguanylate cyclase/phosphodiesterase [Sphingomonas desiccabilis]|uniref:putative bifunctional diguanylate cyclase/phosphodiesterase n=1 Tax=Sphingomonas desiccabilis TaxID=429134 RepID=UPI0013EB2C60|nr:EAL domain-containing protein [Sphingomonas desiccabilis]MBB3910795.1 diguanylate cyclase (GGDEF)-like protein/PAS domain S-box-containing protein [Sphingomonas desiccabilis]
MRRAKISVDEGARLAAVAEYGLSDPKTDARLQEIAGLAARRFEAPVALVTLVRETDQMFVAVLGLQESGTPRDISFCSHALDSDDLLIVPDATLDPRFSGNPLVLGPPHVRFYAGAPLRSPSGHVVGTLCVIDRRPRSGFSARDRQALRALGVQAAQRLEELRLAHARAGGPHRFRQAAGASPDAVASTNAKGQVAFWNEAAVRLFGVPASEAMGRDLVEFLPSLRNQPDTSARPDERVDGDARGRDGSLFPVEVLLHASPSGQDVVVRSIESRRRSDDLAFHAANRDTLTGLPNRVVLMERITEHLARGEQIHLLHVGLEGLHHLDPAASPGSRDLALQKVARRLVESVSPADTVTRLDEDEFAILRPAEAGEPRSAALVVADRILGSLIAPVEIGKQRLRLRAQVGIACFPKHADTTDALMAAAGVALQDARREGRRTRRVYGETLKHEPLEEGESGETLAQALARGEFELFYQPQVDLVDGSLIGAEALIRWNHPERGLLIPGEFLDQIEHGPLAVDVGTWVLETACSQAVGWRRREPRFRMGVNLFEAQFRGRDLAGEVRAILDRTGLSPAGLELEVTEKIMLRNDAATLEALVSLHAQGVRVAFDDFGTGYAALSMLKACPLNRLKVDRSFVQDIKNDGPDALIVAAIATLGAGLGLDVLAEGIEDEAQWELVRTSGCRSGQGYLFGRPMPASQFEDWMRHQASPRSSEVRA